MYWSTSNTFAVGQALVLRTSWARSRFRLPPTPTEASLGRPILSDLQAIKQGWAGMIEQQETKLIARQKEALRASEKSKQPSDPEEILRRKQLKIEFERSKLEEDKIKREGWMNATSKRVSTAVDAAGAPSKVAEAHGVKAGSGDGQGWQAAAAARAATGRLSVKSAPTKADSRSAAERELETMRARRMRAEELVAAAGAKRPTQKRK